MKESLVQWTLLQNLGFLSKSLDFDVSSKKGQEVTTAFGRIDFILENNHKEQLIVELETTLDTKAKIGYCFDQILRYKNVRYTDVTNYCILYAIETTYECRNIVGDFGKSNDILIKTYSINDVKQLYAKTVERLSLSFGLSLPKPANYTICFLRWLNKILKPFRDFDKSELNEIELAKYFTSADTTNFRCYLKLALDFEMLSVSNSNYKITDAGLEYILNFNPDIDTATSLSSVDLTSEQRKILLRIITNGNWTAHKVNIYWFLRFLEVTNGEWLPNIKDFETDKLELANGLFGVTYKSRTMYEFLKFACNWCMELELVDKIKSTKHYDRIYLTPLGIEINNIFSLDLQLKKSRLNLNFKYLD
jgi:transposase